MTNVRDLPAAGADIPVNVTIPAASSVAKAITFLGTLSNEEKAQYRLPASATTTELVRKLISGALISYAQGVLNQQDNDGKEAAELEAAQIKVSTLRITSIEEGTANKDILDAEANASNNRQKAIADATASQAIIDLEALYQSVIAP